MSQTSRLDQVFTAFQTSNLPFCVWKSLEHLEKQLLGDGDLDLLVTPSTHHQQRDILMENGFLPVKQGSCPPWITMYITFDPVVNKFILLHVHRAMVFGRKFSKEYIYPPTSEALKYAQVTHGVPVLSVEHEFMTRVLSAVVKNDMDKNRAYIQTLANKANASSPTLDRDAKHYLGMGADECIQFLKTGSTGQLVAVDRVKKTLIQQRPGYFFFARLAGIYRSLSAKVRGRLVRGYKVRPCLHIALLGIDGSGKSTTCETLLKLAGKAMPMKRIYMGHNEFSAFSMCVLKAYRHFKSSRIPFLRDIWALAWFFTSKLDIHLRRLKGTFYSWRGYNVIYDRYFYDHSLGVRADDPNKPKWKRFARKLLNKFSRIYAKPDIAILIDVPEELAYQRKEQYSFEICREMRHQYLKLFEELAQQGQPSFVFSSEHTKPDALAGAILEKIWEAKCAKRKHGHVIKQ